VTFQRLVIADCTEYMPQMPSAMVDLIVTDPPYNISPAGGKKATKVGNSIVNTDFGNGWDRFDSSQDYDDFIRGIFKEYFRLLKAGGSAYVWLDRAYVGIAWRMALEVGLIPKNILVAVKRNPLPGILKRNNWRSGYETVLYMTKGKANTFNFLSQDKMVNVLYYTIGNKDTDHPTEKPLEITEHFIRVSSKEGDLVLDTFAGSGVTLEACRMLDRNCIGIERDAIWKDVIEKKAMLKQSSLPDAFWTKKDGRVQKRLDIPEEEAVVKKQDHGLSNKLWKRKASK
jgi:site-specific DNA-methyltransferase (adenine-specific)